MIPRRFLGWALAACALLCASAPALAAPPDLTARPAAHAADWPPGDALIVKAAPIAARAERADLIGPSTYRPSGPIGRASHLFSTAGHRALAIRTARPAPS